MLQGRCVGQSRGDALGLVWGGAESRGDVWGQCVGLVLVCRPSVAGLTQQGLPQPQLQPSGAAMTLTLVRAGDRGRPGRGRWRKRCHSAISPRLPPALPRPVAPRPARPPPSPLLVPTAPISEGAGSRSPLGPLCPPTSPWGHGLWGRRARGDTPCHHPAAGPCSRQHTPLRRMPCVHPGCRRLRHAGRAGDMRGRACVAAGCRGVFLVPVSLPESAGRPCVAPRLGAAAAVTHPAGNCQQPQNSLGTSCLPSPACAPRPALPVPHAGARPAGCHPRRDAPEGLRCPRPWSSPCQGVLHTTVEVSSPWWGSPGCCGVPQAVAEVPRHWWGSPGRGRGPQAVVGSPGCGRGPQAVAEVPRPW